ncbi:MAG: Na+/H+ antiporter subunit B [Chloroflexi bacterium]|nr:MAG: Na+/H+ antiporter subunit B [Chloroflexota bacterium]
MTSVILSTATRYMLPLLLLFSVFLLLRGHSEPGGGFVGGLVAAASFAFYAFAYNVKQARRALRINPRVFIGVGLLIAVSSATYSLFLGKSFMTGIWTETEFPVFGAIGTPFIFDVGVYLVVLGVILTIVFSLAEGEQ